MARKAQLDEIDLDLPPEDDEQLLDEDDEKEEQKTGDEEDGGKEEGRKISFLGEKTGLVIFCVLGCLLIIGVAWGTWHFVKKGKETPPPMAKDVQTQEETVPAPEVLTTRQMAFQGFIIPLSEGTGYRLLEVSFTVEILEGQGVQKGDMVNDPGIRRQIVNAIQARGNDLFTAKNSRAVVKNDLLTLMTQILGENVVKNVYVTDFKFI